MKENSFYEVWLSEDCIPGGAIHELGHAIGFQHEHQRPDRDEYIKVKDANLVEGAKKNYKKIPALHLSDFGVGYDYASVMHYGKDAFAKKGLDAFEVLGDLPECLQDVGQRVTISSKDIELANKLYKCPEKPIPSLCELMSWSLDKKSIKRSKTQN